MADSECDNDETAERARGGHEVAQPAAPTAPDGTDLGPLGPKEAEAPPTPNEGAPGATPWLRAADGAPLQSETQTLNVCPYCAAAIPLGALKCPGCQRFAKANPGSNRRPRKNDVETVLENLLAEYRPATVVLKETCEHLARAYAELKTIPAGSLEWHRILNITQELSKNLEAARPAQTPSDFDAISEMNNEQMLEQTLTIARHLIGLLDATPAYEPRITDAATTPDAAPAPPPEPEPICEFCHQTPSRCEDIKATRLDAWQALHYADPTEVERRRKEATAEMLESMGRARRGDFPRW